MNSPLLVLASNSPRRRELLALGGWKFQSLPTDVDESQHVDEAPEKYVVRLAMSKAQFCSESASDGGTILGADTAVVNGDVIMGKPKDNAEAEEMLRSLRGHNHKVMTGITVINRSLGKLITDLCITDVPMRDYSDGEIETYVCTGDPLDKAGAYAIQHAGFHPVENLSGCYACVMGLPLCHLARSLKKVGILPKTDIASACQFKLGYPCSIFSRVLQGEINGNSERVFE